MAGIYAARSLSVYKLTFNSRGDADAIIDPADLGGKDVLDLLDSFCAKSAAPAQVGNDERFIRFGSCAVSGDRAFAKFSSGRAGLRVSVLDTTILEDSGIEYGESMAGMVECRLLLRRTPGLGYAIACVESVPNGGGVTAPLTLFKRYVNGGGLGVTMKYEQIHEVEALDGFKGIEEIELRRYGKPDDVSSGTVVNSGLITHRVGHKRGLLMPLALFGGFLKDRRAVAEYMGVAVDYDGDEDLFVTLRQKDGRSRKYCMGKELAVPIREVLNESGEEPPSDEEFAERCVEACIRAEDTMDRLR